MRFCSISLALIIISWRMCIGGGRFCAIGWWRRRVREWGLGKRGMEKKVGRRGRKKRLRKRFKGRKNNKLTPMLKWRRNYKRKRSKKRSRKKSTTQSQSLKRN
jgi:hypothetical protein